MLRYWVGEHHLNPALGSTSPMVLLSHLAARTGRIRLGVAATLVAYHPPLRLAEDATLLSALSGGRTDLGLGRSVAARTPRTVGLDHDRPHVEAGCSNAAWAPSPDAATSSCACSPARSRGCRARRSTCSTP